MDLFSELEWRGLLYASTEGAREWVRQESVTAYIGFDPTAASLHVGPQLQVIVLAHLQRHGHTPIAVVGGGTGLIGDPSGKTAERQLLSRERVGENVRGIRGQLERFLDFGAVTNAARLVDNADWLCSLAAIDFMRDVGKHFTVNAMLAKESVKRRIESEEGLSFTEFSYSLLQAYDYLMLHDRFGCSLQMGGSDQYGNILAGADLIRRVRARKVHGIVVPLLTTAAGTKFGKTEAGAVWLDATLTTPYAFYQFWLHTDDRDAGRYLRFFTFKTREEIETLERASAEEPERRHAQRALARAVTELVHGTEAVRDAESAASTLFTGGIAQMSVRDLLDALAQVPSFTLPEGQGEWKLVPALVDAGVAASRSEATRLIRSGGVYVNDRRITDEKETLEPGGAIGGELFVVRRGKREMFLLRVARG